MLDQGLVFRKRYLEGAISVKKNGIRITTTLGNKIMLELELESLENKLTNVMNLLNIDKQVTIYLQGGMGMSITKVEGKLKDIGTKEYAQYNGAPFVVIVPKGKRKPVRYMQTYDPYMLVLEGVNHPDISDGFEVVSSDSLMTVKHSKYTSFDDRWKEDADKEIDSYLALSDTTILADFRGTKGFSSYTGKTTDNERK